MTNATLEGRMKMPWLGTRRWAAQILGSWRQEEVRVVTVPKHELPLEVLANVAHAWEQLMRNVGKELGSKGVNWRITPDQPYARMEVPRGDFWGLRMFAGPQTRIEKYVIIGEKLTLAHSPANYAESMATNNIDPWGLIRAYGGRTALADGHAVSVALTGIDAKGKEVMQFFKRGKGLGEYGGYIGTAAGNSQKPELTPFDIAYKESAEEARVVPFLHAYIATLNESGVMPFLPGGSEEYKRLGLATSNFEIVEKINGGARVRFLNRRGIEDYATLLSPETQFMLTGLALNVDTEDKTPHHKSEYLFIARTKLPVEALNSPKFGWVRNDEHAEALYVPFTERALTEFAVENFLELMPPTHAVTLSAIRAEFGQDAFERALKATNSVHPVQGDHPLERVLQEGIYTLPLIVQR